MPIADLAQLQEDLVFSLRSSEEIVARAQNENRLLNDDEKTQLAAHKTKAAEIKAEIAAIEENARITEETQKEVAAMRGTVTKAPASSQPADTPNHSSPRIEFPAYMHRYGSLKAFKGRDAEQNAYKMGQWALATIYGNHRARQWCQKNGVGVQNALSEGINSAGGALVPDEMERAIIDLREVYGVFRRNTKLVPMSSDTKTVPRRTGGLTMSFTSEGSALSSTDKTWNNVNLVAKKLGGYTLLSTELDEDAIINLADDLASEFAYAAALKEDQCGFIGDGTSTYGGIMGLFTKLIVGLGGSGTQYGSAIDIAGVDHNLFTEIDLTDITLFMAKLPQYARARGNCKWYCSQAFNDSVFSRLKTAASGNTTVTLEGKLMETFLGYPVEISQVLPDGIATDYNNLVVCAFGDLSLASMMGERRGFNIKRSDEIKFLEDQIAIKGTERVDIVVHDIGSLGNAGAGTPGPIIGLVASSS